MKQVKRLWRGIVPALFVLLCIALGVGAALSQTAQQPDNPLAVEVSPSHMLLSGSGGDGSGGTDGLDGTNESAEQQQQQPQNVTEPQTQEAAQEQDQDQLQTQDQTQSQNQSVQQPVLQTAQQAGETDGSGQNETGRTTTEGTSAGGTQQLDGETDGSDGNGEDSSSQLGDEQTASGETTEQEYFTTTIQDGETVGSRSYSFEIYHCDSTLTVRSERVYVNGTEQLQFHGSVLLAQGENTVRVAVVYTGADGKRISVYRDYTVYVVQEELTPTPTPTPTLTPTPAAAQQPSIVTTLTNQTVHDASLAFTAGIENGSGSARLTVVCNGKTITAESGGTGVYSVSLVSGTNIIRLKLTDTYQGEKLTINEIYTVSYVPLATEETAPQLLYCNVTDGMSVNGTAFTLDLKPVDYEGNRIYYNGITVRLNGTVCAYTWASEYTSYLLSLQNGSNTLEVRITDTEGRYSDYVYTVNCTAVSDGDPIGTITISLDAAVLGIGDIIAPTSATIYQGESAAAVVVRFLEENGITETHSGSLTDGFYLSRIGLAGICASVSIPEKLVEEINEDGLEWKAQHYTDSLGEFDYCQGSGWMYSINGSFPGYGLSDAVFQDGDVVRIRYTLAYGKDIGGYSSTGGGDANYEVTW